MPTVSALRRQRAGRIAVELDGAPWRVLPVAAVAAAGLYEGCELDRERARRLSRARRRAEALDVAAAALRRRALSERELDERLTRRRIPSETRGATRDVLERAGYVDDERLAHERARALADRGRGDAAIRWDLEQRGIDPATTDEALGSLPPEAERAHGIVERRGRTAQTARFLASHGFDDEAIAAALGDEIASDP